MIVACTFCGEHVDSTKAKREMQLWVNDSKTGAGTHTGVTRQRATGRWACRRCLLSTPGQEALL